MLELHWSEMHTFLNVPYFIKCLHTIVVCFRTMCLYFEQVEDIEHYSASIRDDLDAK